MSHAVSGALDCEFLIVYWKYGSNWVCPIFYLAALLRKFLHDAVSDYKLNLE